MKEGFRDWIAEVEAARPALDAMVAQLTEYGATIKPHLEREVGALNYMVQFPSAEGATTSVVIRLKDHESDSDLVITNMTTLPDSQKGKGHGSEAIRHILEWAAKNNLRTVRATQVSDPDSGRFWKKNGFTQVKNSKTGDFLFTISETS